MSAPTSRDSRWIQAVSDNPQPLSAQSLRRLHRAALEDRHWIREAFERLHAQRSPLRRALNRMIEPETAVVTSLGATSMVLRPKNFTSEVGAQLRLRFEIDDAPYFFATAVRAVLPTGEIETEIPEAIYLRERRDHGRVVSKSADRGDDVAIRFASGALAKGIVEDSSPEGLGVSVPRVPEPNEAVTVSFLSGERAGDALYGEVRHFDRSTDREGWVRVGLSVSTVPPGRKVDLLESAELVPGTSLQKAWQRIYVAKAGLQVASRRAARKLGVLRTPQPLSVDLHEYTTESGETIRAIVDSHGDPNGATAILIPPAWGRTKETLLPLARVIVSTFEKLREPVVVLRFDGIRRRGESLNDPGCRRAGAEYHHFTFSQGVRDIAATARYVKESPRIRAGKIVLVTFSAAAVDGRCAVARDHRELIDGWISVVGLTDLQSSMRTISGGVDYAFGLTQGVRFGLQEILGVVVDMDRAGLDAIDERMAFMEDARLDMASINVPITWIHGRYDAWTDVDRVRDLMSCGPQGERRLIQVPSGHQLRTSSEALDVFGIISSEIVRMALGREVRAVLPDLAAVDRRREAERGRLPKKRVDLREFWMDYLLGRDRQLGIDLMTATTAYQELMRVQVAGLGLASGARVADLGAGTGSLPVYLKRSHAESSVTVHEIDLVGDALRRAQVRLDVTGPTKARVECLIADLGHPGVSIPVRSHSYDSALASLLVSYLDDPVSLLLEAKRILRPGGKLVVSSLRRDADISKLFADASKEITKEIAREYFGEIVADRWEAEIRSFLNDASRLLDLEEYGKFRFWDADELAALVSGAGLAVERTVASFGRPPQAVVVIARRT
jgi:ubiquinone/menaquinone biosynthesis C-methylase UbiE